MPYRIAGIGEILWDLLPEGHQLGGAPANFAYPFASAQAFSHQPGLPVDIVDTVGAGDAFTAALTLGLLAGRPLDEINPFANQVARHVCAHAGATPPLPPALANRFRAP